MSNFVKVDETAPYITSSGEKKTQIKSVDYLITHEFANGMFNSCKEVQMPSTNEKALTVFCGHTAAQCTIKVWLDYMGDTSNGHTPFTINFNITDKPWFDPTTNMTYFPMNELTTKCNETALNKSACSCQDCKASCSEIPSYPKPTKPPTILGFDSWYFIMFILYIIFVLFFGTYVLCYNIIFLNTFGVKEKSNRYDSTTEDRSDLGSDSINGEGRRVKRNLANVAAPLVNKNSINCFEKIGAKIENFLQTVFTKWGTCCARHPIIVIVLGIIVAGGLSAGITMFKVTTNPVELWSAKNSRARTEKDYFDSHFG